MQNPFRIGDTKTYTHIVTATDTATFESGTVHNVYSTFALARDAEWSGRLFVLEMKEPHEEGIGTGINIAHHAPALIGQEVTFIATLTAVEKNEIITTYTAHVGSRLIATGTQWQKILNKEKLEGLFTSCVMVG
jgi:predicted thioesterase